MSDQDKHLAREAAKKLLAWADGKTLEWAFGDPNNCDPSRMVVSDVGSERVRIRPIAQAKPPEWPPKPTDAQLRKWGKVIAEDKPRAPLKGETFYAYCGGDDFDIATATVNNDANPLSFGGLRWILKDAPKVELPCPPKPTPEQVAAARLPDGVVGRISDEAIIADAIEDGLIGIDLAQQSNARGDAHSVLACLDAAKMHLRAGLDALRILDAQRNGYPDTSPVAGNPVTANAGREGSQT